ncbi:MAG: transcriptional repressor LexA, partial [Parcubacteria group bacterium]|nr:transcriptional repressor LexA [Parcubacteria group bacterium]
YNTVMLTKRQKQVLNYITRHTEKYGFSPSFSDIRGKLKLRALSTIHQHVAALEQKGYLERQKPYARSIITSGAEKMVQIPLLGRIAAGVPIEAIEDRETIAVPQNRLPFPIRDCYALRVAGDSMIEENIHDSDLVLVKKQSTAENGQRVVALLNGYDTTLKKFYKERTHIRLEPANKTLSPIIVDKGTPLAIQGVVLGVVEDIAVSAPKSTREHARVQHEILPQNKIICGDVVEIMKTFPPGSIDLVVTSPPYDELRTYNGYHFNFEGIAKGLFRVMKKGGVVVWVVGDKIKKGNRSLTSFRQALYFQSIGFNAHDVMIYKKRNTPFMRTNAYTNCFEFMFVFSKGTPQTFRPLKVKTARQGYEMLTFNKGPDGVNKKILGELKPEKTMTNIWEYAVGLHGTTSDAFAFEHPAVFPEKLVEDHVLSWTKPGDVVFDPMCGSGTTCKMAKKNNRSYIGCDISPEYVELSKRRLKAV